MFTRAMAGRLTALAWWTWIDPDPNWGACGLLTRELQPKPSYTTYATLTSKLTGATFQESLSASQLGTAGVEAYRFAAKNGTLYVLWSTDAASHSVTLGGAGARIVDMNGNDNGVIADAADGASDGQVNLQVGQNPVFVEIVP
jgi:hypothetical protein